MDSSVESVEWSVNFDEDNVLLQLQADDEINLDYGTMQHPAYRARIKLAFKLLSQIHYLLDYVSTGIMKSDFDPKEPFSDPMSAVQTYLSTIDKLALNIDAEGKQSYRPWIAEEMATLFQRLDAMLAPPPLRAVTPPKSMTSSAAQTEPVRPALFAPPEPNVSHKDFLQYKLMTTRVAQQQHELNKLARTLTSAKNVEPPEVSQKHSRAHVSCTKPVKSPKLVVKKPVKAPALAPYDERKQREAKNAAEEKRRAQKLKKNQQARIARLETDLASISEETKAQLKLQELVQSQVRKMLDKDKMEYESVLSKLDELSQRQQIDLERVSHDSKTLQQTIHIELQTQLSQTERKLQEQEAQLAAVRDCQKREQEVILQSRDAIEHVSNKLNEVVTHTQAQQNNYDTAVMTEIRTLSSDLKQNEKLFQKSTFSIMSSYHELSKKSAELSQQARDVEEIKSLVRRATRKQDTAPSLSKRVLAQGPSRLPLDANDNHAGALIALELAAQVHDEIDLFLPAEERHLVVQTKRDTVDKLARELSSQLETNARISDELQKVRSSHEDIIKQVKFREDLEHKTELDRYSEIILVMFIPLIIFAVFYSLPSIYIMIF
jgi:hypothetical protein